MKTVNVLVAAASRVYVPDIVEENLKRYLCDKRVLGIVNKEKGY